MDVPCRNEFVAIGPIIVAGVRGRRWVRPSGLAIALVVVGIGAFSYLGFWQLHRATDKEALLASYAGAEEIAAIPLEDARRREVGIVNPHVSVRGRFDAVHGYLLDDQIREGRQGVIAFAVFEPDNGRQALLVNRGFIEKVRVAGLPSLPKDEIEITGLYAPSPGSGLRLGGNALPKQEHWPKLTIYIDPKEIGEDLGREIDTRVLLLDADPASGFVREWTPQVMAPERHRGYAFQWFCFAIASIVIFIVLHWRREPGESS